MLRVAMRAGWVFAGVGTVILVTAFVGYKLGYRFGNNFKIGKLGIVSMEIPIINTDIFVDQNKKITTTKDNETVKLSLSPRQHTIIISRLGYFPWKKDFTVPSGGAVNLFPIFVTQNASGQIIKQNDPEYWKLRQQVLADKLPTKDSPRISKDGSVSIWLENNAIIVKFISPRSDLGLDSKVVIQPETQIKNVYFYKDRSDAVIFSTGDSVFVIETNKTGTQNFIPIFKGTNPHFIETDPNFIYVLDGETLMEVVI